MTRRRRRGSVVVGRRTGARAMTAGRTSEGRVEGGTAARAPPRHRAGRPADLGVVVFVVQAAPANDRGAAASSTGSWSRCRPRRAHRAVAERRRPLRAGAADDRPAVVGDGAGRGVGPDGLQPRPRRGLARRAEHRLPPARLPVRAPGHAGGPSPRGGRDAADPRPLRPHRAGGRRLPGADALVGDVRPDCPANALQVTSSQPGRRRRLIRPVREVLAVLLVLAVTVVLVRRARSAGRSCAPRCARHPPGGLPRRGAGRLTTWSGPSTPRATASPSPGGCTS